MVRISIRIPKPTATIAKAISAASAVLIDNSGLVNSMLHGDRAGLSRMTCSITTPTGQPELYEMHRVGDLSTISKSGRVGSEHDPARLAVVRVRGEKGTRESRLDDEGHR